MGQRIELIGVDDRSRDADDDDRSASVSRTVTVTRQGLGGRRRTAVAAAGLLLVLAVLFGRGSSTSIGDSSPGVERAQPNPPIDRVVIPPVRTDAPGRWEAPRIEPVAVEAEGITLVVGRGIEKTFIQLDSGTKTVVDVEGLPIAGVSGFLALSIEGDDRSAEPCWFSLAERECVDGPPPTVDAGVRDFDPAQVRALNATSTDRRWSAGWRAGQLIVTDGSTGNITVVPDIRRSYFDDALVLIG